MTEASFQILIKAVVELITPVIGAFILVYLSRMKTQADQAAVKVDSAAKLAVQVADRVAVVAEKAAGTDAKLNEMAEVGIKTHVLVNSNMGVQLQLNERVTKRLADMTKDPADNAAADLAARMYAEHQGKQAMVDTSEKKD